MSDTFNYTTANGFTVAHDFPRSEPVSRIDLDTETTIWVCDCCMYSHANGECCPDDDHGGDGIEPWDCYPFDRFDVAMGITDAEHSEHCTEDGRERGCDCDRDPFSSRPCDGCGSYLAGERHGFTQWELRTA